MEEEQNEEVFAQHWLLVPERSKDLAYSLLLERGMEIRRREGVEKYEGKEQNEGQEQSSNYKRNNLTRRRKHRLTWEKTYLFEIEESSQEQIQVSLDEETEKRVPDELIVCLRTASLEPSLFEVDLRDRRNRRDRKNKQEKNEQSEENAWILEEIQRLVF